MLVNSTNSIAITTPMIPSGLNGVKRKSADVETNPLLAAAKRLKKDVMSTLVRIWCFYLSISEICK